MDVMTVGIRDLKARLSEYMRQVKQGNVIEITEYGKPVGRLYPHRSTTRNAVERSKELVEAGLVAWNGQKLPARRPTVVNRSDELLSDIVIEERI
jgi:prevent-host-death family protein